MTYIQINFMHFYRDKVIEKRKRASYMWTWETTTSGSSTAPDTAALRTTLVEKEMHS